MRMARGATVVELLVVLSIIGVLLALLLPAIQAVRERARDTVCNNNLYQINMGLVNFAESHKRLPPPSVLGKIGGWMIEVLPYVEQQNLKERIALGGPVTDAPDFLFRAPRLFRCPKREVLDNTPEDRMQPGHYVFAGIGGRESFMLFDTPVNMQQAWVSSPEVLFSAMAGEVGPHSKGFFYTHGFQQSVSFMVNGEDVGQ